MYVLHSFSNLAVLSLGKEQFLAVYLSAGVIASLASVLYKALTVQAGLSIGAVNHLATLQINSLQLFYDFSPVP